MKRCSRCRKQKRTDQFNRFARNKDGLQPACRACQQEWYHEHKAQHLVNVRRRNIDYRSAVRQYKWGYLSTHPCVDCGETDPVVLEFDHVIGTKVKEISAMHGHSMDKIKAEIKKCVVRCANCHRRKTAHDFGHYASVVQ